MYFTITHNDGMISNVRADRENSYIAHEDKNGSPLLVKNVSEQTACSYISYCAIDRGASITIHPDWW